MYCHVNSIYLGTQKLFHSHKDFEYFFLLLFVGIHDINSDAFRECNSDGGWGLNLGSGEDFTAEENK